MSEKAISKPLQTDFYPFAQLLAHPAALF
jgi:hypothetical protein